VRKDCLTVCLENVADFFPRELQQPETIILA